MAQVVQSTRPSNTTVQQTGNSSTSGIIPIIDLSDPNAGKVMMKACNEHGFFYIDNREGQEMAITLTEQLLEKSKQFHQLSQEIKDQYAIEKSVCHRGYASGTSFFANRIEKIRKDETPNVESDKSRPTASESFNFCSPNLLNDANKSGITDGNFYPSELGTQFPDLVRQYKDSCLRLHKRIFQHLIPHLNMDTLRKNNEPISDWDDSFHDLTWLFRCVYYPHTTGELVPHTDRGVLSILLQDEVEGLQVWFQEKWIDVPPIKNTFLVNIADMLQEMSSKTLKSTFHRVVNNGNKERFSIPFFVQLGKSMKAYLQKEEIWYSQYEHVCNFQYKVYKYLSDRVPNADDLFKGKAPEEIDAFHYKLMSDGRKSIGEAPEEAC
jgi:isopenicillin N synthase-like dioxygenase